MASLVSKSYSKKLLRLISWSHWFTFFNIFAAILLSTLYLFSEPAPETVIGQVYLITTWFSHMAFLTFVSFVLIVFPVVLLLPYTRFIRGFASIVFTITLVVLVLDGFTYKALGYHLYSSSFDQVIELIMNALEKDTFGFVMTATLISAFILLFELVVSNYAWKHIHQLQKTTFAKYTMVGLVTAFLTSHLIHIWADANLEYDILKQDTLFPMAYPMTAKTLLTKYDLFDKDIYLESKTAPLAFKSPVGQYPTLNQCPEADIDNRSLIIVLNKNGLKAAQIEQFAQRASTKRVRLAHHIDNANSQNAWFNLLYGLPTIYQQAILAQNKAPLSFQLLEKISFSKNLTYISENKALDMPTWVATLFDTTEQHNSVKSLIFGDHFAKMNAGLHVYYFDNDNDYQLELFVDALLLAQKNQKQKDMIYVSGLGSTKEVMQLAIKPALLLWPNSKQRKIPSKVRTLTSQMDIQPTIMEAWLQCNKPNHSYSTGNNIFTLDHDKNRIVANSTPDGLMIFEKDKSVFVDALGNFQGYSRQLNAPISIQPDYPLMISGVKNIKAYTGTKQ